MKTGVQCFYRPSKRLDSGLRRNDVNFQRPSTIFAMILRYYDVAAGTVTIDGQDIRIASFATLRDRQGADGTVTKELEPATIDISLAKEEIRVGDNDRLAAKVAQMIQAEHLVILTSVDGLYDRPPQEPGARLAGHRQRLELAALDQAEH